MNRWFCPMDPGRMRPQGVSGVGPWIVLPACGTLALLAGYLGYLLHVLPRARVRGLLVVSDPAGVELARLPLPRQPSVVVGGASAAADIPLSFVPGNHPMVRLWVEVDASGGAWRSGLAAWRSRPAALTLAEAIWPYHLYAPQSGPLPRRRLDLDGPTPFSLAGFSFVYVPADGASDVPLHVPVHVPLHVPVHVPVRVPVHVPVRVPVHATLDGLADVPPDTPPVEAAADSAGTRAARVRDTGTEPPGRGVGASLRLVAAAAAARGAHAWVRRGAAAGVRGLGWAGTTARRLGRKAARATGPAAVGAARGLAAATAGTATRGPGLWTALARALARTARVTGGMVAQAGRGCARAWRWLRAARRPPVGGLGRTPPAERRSTHATSRSAPRRARHARGRAAPPLHRRSPDAPPPVGAGTTLVRRRRATPPPSAPAPPLPSAPPSPRPAAPGPAPRPRRRRGERDWARVLSPSARAKGSDLLGFLDAPRPPRKR